MQTEEGPKVNPHPDFIQGNSWPWAVGSTFRLPANRGGFRVWRVVGVFLGARGQQSVIELESLDLAGCTEGRMCVPVEILDAAQSFVAVEPIPVEQGGF